MKRRRTKFLPNTVELFTYDYDKKEFNPIGEDNPIPVVVMGAIDEGDNMVEFIIDNGSPSDDFGNKGDIYLDAITGDFYKKDDTAWNLKANLSGKDGKDGEDGKDGVNGKDGEDGFMSESEFNSLMTTIGDMQEAIDGLSNTISDLQDEINNLKDN